ncbi:hypothetical protein AK812_SmicGene25395 [Symbiodinium microadriaticum]|uniref:Uncharacterized protein n=1 Tax=Symbiodinium microadriaticum TaxID=2951 RepID=A0A1Q9DC98_SYMMI|nr:hypothetical protein AK812_SmicGene25395 [Symbiodinium microadriaticum]
MSCRVYSSAAQPGQPVQVTRLQTVRFIRTSILLLSLQAFGRSAGSSQCNTSDVYMDWPFFLFCPEVLLSGEQCEAVCGPGLVASFNVHCQVMWQGGSATSAAMRGRQ